MAKFINTADVIGDDNVIDSIIDRSITEYADGRITSIGDYAFNGCSALTTVNCPAVTKIGNSAFTSCKALTTVDFPLVTIVPSFNGCTKLTTVNCPSATSIGGYTLSSCTSLTTVNFPSVTGIADYAFNLCTRLTTSDFPRAYTINSNAFNGCSVLTALILRSETMCRLSNTNAFTKCYHILGTVDSTYNPNGDKDGYIYVPSALVAQYQAATNWSTYATQFRALEDYTVDGTITGDLDETKI